MKNCGTIAKKRREGFALISFGNDWDSLLSGEFEKDYYSELRSFLIEEYRNCRVYPPAEDIFNALKLTAYENTKAVIIGQDPYHQPGQAHGLCFSVRKGVKVPPSLVNIFKELKEDLGIEPPRHGCLTEWAERGVLLLNATLTVRDSEPMSHRGKGWEILTDRIIEILNRREKPMCFILWGNSARAKAELITNTNHMILEGAHPSPFSAHNGFFGGRYFSRTNRFLEACGEEEIDWRLSE